MHKIVIDPSEARKGFTSSNIPNFVLKSLSLQSWTHWYHKPGKTDDWIESMHKAAKRKLRDYGIREEQDDNRDE